MRISDWSSDVCSSDLQGIAVATVIGFPSGAHQPAVKAHEAEVAVDAGATEVDMVINLGLAKAAEWRAVSDDIAAVRAGAPQPALLTVIIETGALTHDENVRSSHVAAEAGPAHLHPDTHVPPTR